MANFTPALKKVLKFEGGYANDKDDAGGETYKGIARKFHKNSIMWAEVDKVTKATKNVKQINLLLEQNEIVQKEIARIYKHDYWDALHLDEVKSETIAYQLFDTAVNMGVSKAIKLAQKTVGQPQTGKFNYSWFTLIRDWNG